MNTSTYSIWPIYLSAILLILNDHILKYEYPGFVTGKLSDIAGVFLVTLLLRTLFKKQVYLSSLFIILLFVYWKSPYSEGLLIFLNENIPLNFVRTIDYTDLFALLVIPFSHYVYRFRSHFELKKKTLHIFKLPMLCMLGLSIMGTSVMLPHHKYAIQKKNNSESINVSKVISIIKEIVEPYGLKCVTCDENIKNGEFSGEGITLKYILINEDKGVKFDIEGSRGSIFRKSDDFDILEKIRRRLKNLFENNFKNMEFVIDLNDPGSFE